MKFKQIIFQYKLHHIFIWLLVFAAWLYLRYQDYSTLQTALTVTIIKVADIAMLIYICNYVLIPRLLYKKKYTLFAACFFIMIVVSSIYKMHLLGIVTNNPSLTNFLANWKVRVYD